MFLGIVVTSFNFRTAIILGTAIPLGLFLVWNAVILGSLPTLETGADQIIDPLQQLRSTSGVVGVNIRFTVLMIRFFSWVIFFFFNFIVNLTNNASCFYMKCLQPIVDTFSLLAIATSYIGFVLGLSDFMADCEWFLSSFYSPYSLS